MRNNKVFMILLAMAFISSGTVYAESTFVENNDRSVVHKDSAGKAAAFPDTCLSPPSPPAGPIPIPYPRTSSAKDTAKGSRKVKVDGKPTLPKSKGYSTATGDEEGTEGNDGMRELIRDVPQF